MGTHVGRSPPNGMMGPAQLKSLGPYLARHLIWTAMTPPKDDPIGSHAHIVALELWSVHVPTEAFSHGQVKSAGTPVGGSQALAL